MCFKSTMREGVMKYTQCRVYLQYMLLCDTAAYQVFFVISVNYRSIGNSLTSTHTDGYKYRQ